MLICVASALCTDFEKRTHRYSQLNLPTSTTVSVSSCAESQPFVEPPNSVPNDDVSNVEIPREIERTPILRDASSESENSLVQHEVPLNVSIQNKKESLATPQMQRKKKCS